MSDIYFKEEYGKLYEEIENGKCYKFILKKEYGSISHLFIKREIFIKIDGKNYYDIITPYGYGGPLIQEYKEGFKEKLINEFYIEFEKYCKENNIVSEFIRFHPIMKNAEDFKKYYDVIYLRDTLGTNISEYSDPVQFEFSKSCKNKIKKSLNEGVAYKITKNPENISNFKDIYYSTMDRNNAENYYYFNEKYFDKCLELLKENIVVVEAIYKKQTIAMGFYFMSEGIIHIHLSGTLTEFLYLSPAYILRYAITNWAKENNFKLIHHGGGRSNSKDDGLYQFKKRFAKNTEFKFYIGKKIWNQEIYNKLCENTENENEDDFFPAYRKNN